jgi:hypothetical protein
MKNSPPYFTIIEPNYRIFLLHSMQKNNNNNNNMNQRNIPKIILLLKKHQDHME